MNKKIIKIAYILIVSMLLSFASYANVPTQEDIITQCIKNHKEALPEALNDSYEVFKGIVASKSNFGNIAVAWSNFDVNNTNLIIGSSGVVYCGAYMGNEELTKYGFDLVGFGGIFDKEALDLLSVIKEKKYKNIVLFGGVNDMNIRAVNGFKNIDMIYCTTLIDFINEAKKHLLDENSKVYYVKVKHMTYGRDGMENDFMDRFNNMAFEVNTNIENFGYVGYDIPFETTEEYSDAYIHFKNKIVFETMFDFVNNN